MQMHLHVPRKIVSGLFFTLVVLAPMSYDSKLEIITIPSVMKRGVCS